MSQSFIEDDDTRRFFVIERARQVGRSQLPSGERFHVVPRKTADYTPAGGAKHKKGKR